MISSARQCDKCSAMAKYRFKVSDLSFCGHHWSKVPDELKTDGTYEALGSDMSESPEKPGFTADPVTYDESNLPSLPIQMSENEVSRQVASGIGAIESCHRLLAADIRTFFSKLDKTLDIASKADTAEVIDFMLTHPSIMHERDIPEHERHV